MKVYIVFVSYGYDYEEGCLTISGIYSNKKAAVDHVIDHIESCKRSRIDFLNGERGVFGDNGLDSHGNRYGDLLEQVKNFAYDVDTLCNNGLDISELIDAPFDYYTMRIKEEEMHDKYIPEDN